MPEEHRTDKLTRATLAVNSSPDGGCVLVLGGDWLLGDPLPDLRDSVVAQENGSQPLSVAFDTNALGNWDTGLLTALVDLHKFAGKGEFTVDPDGLPEGARRLLNLAFAVKESEGARREAESPGFFAEVGNRTLEVTKACRELLEFFGELTLSLGRFFQGRATYFRQDLFVHIQQAGIEALPIVSLISLLIGMIFAFVGVMQLNNFGAGIYTADLVAVAMIREIAAIMTAIIMAGRTGAAYAAEIGTMKVNEELDALTTLGVNPIDYLVSPRVIALIAMMPLLTLYSSLMGIIGGALVGLSMLDVTLVQYAKQTIDSVEFDSLFGGLFKSVIYGALVAIAGCMQGMACGNSAMAVGVATTKAVVMGIVLIVVSASVLTIIYINLGI